MPPTGLFILNAVTIATGIAIFFMMIYATVVSWQENEPRAARRAFGLSLLLPLPYLIVGLVNFAYQPIFAMGLLALTFLGTALLFWPIKQNNPNEDDTPIGQIDERDIMFSRMLLAEGSARFNAYYKQHPDKKPLDDRFRRRPGLLEKGSTYYNPYAFAGAEASFITVAALHPIVEGIPATEQLKPDPQQMSVFIKNWTKKLGAISVGITE